MYDARSAFGGDEVRIEHLEGVRVIGEVGKQRFVGRTFELAALDGANDFCSAVFGEEGGFQGFGHDHHLVAIGGLDADVGDVGANAEGEVLWQGQGVVVQARKLTLSPQSLTAPDKTGKRTVIAGSCTSL